MMLMTLTFQGHAFFSNFLTFLPDQKINRGLNKRFLRSSYVLKLFSYLIIVVISGKLMNVNVVTSPCHFFWGVFLPKFFHVAHFLGISLTTIQNRNRFYFSKVLILEHLIFKFGSRLNFCDKKTQNSNPHRCHKYVKKTSLCIIYQHGTCGKTPRKEFNLYQIHHR